MVSPHPPHGPHPRHSPEPVLLRGPAPAADWGQRNLCGSIFRTRHELQLLNHEGCMAMVMVAVMSKMIRLSTRVAVWSTTS